MRSWLVLALAAVVACGGGDAAPECFADPTHASRAEAWSTDLRCIRARLDQRHPAPFGNFPAAQFDAEARAIAAAVPALTDPQAAVRVMALVAALRDGHTFVYAPFWSRLAVALRRFPEGIFVVGAEPGLERWLGSRVLAIGGVPIEEVRTRVATLIPQENEQTVAAREAGLLEALEALQGIGVANPGAHQADLLLETGATQTTVAVGTRNVALQPFPATVPRSLAHLDLNYWSEVDDVTRTLYVQYNSCADRADLPMVKFAAELRNVLEGGTVDRAVVDLRWNPGGSTNVNRPLESALEAWEGSADPARFLVLIGPRTFSSAIWAASDLRRATAARLLGETAGGNPNGFGNVVLQTLPWSRLQMQLSTRRYHLTDDPVNRLAPDVAVPWAWSDYAQGIDPVLVAAGMTGG